MSETITCAEATALFRTEARAWRDRSRALREHLGAMLAEQELGVFPNHPKLRATSADISSMIGVTSVAAEDLAAAFDKHADAVEEALLAPTIAGEGKQP